MTKQNSWKIERMKSSQEADFKCFLCWVSLKKNPIYCKNNHKMCFNCLQKHHQNKTCPVCKEEVFVMTIQGENYTVQGVSFQQNVPEVEDIINEDYNRKKEEILPREECSFFVPCPTWWIDASVGYAEDLESHSASLSFQPTESDELLADQICLLKQEKETLIKEVMKHSIEQHMNKLTGEILRTENSELQDVIGALRTKDALFSSDVSCLRFSTGDVFVGSLNERSGPLRGTYVWFTGSVYCGDFSDDGRMQGPDGAYRNVSGGKYSGEFQEGQRHGQGRLTYANGDVYEGTFFFDQRHGRGTLVTTSGVTYRGHWAADHRHGSGVLTDTNEDYYCGDWRRGKPCGEGKVRCICANGERYEGQVLDNRRHGVGMLTSFTGDVYCGEFVDGYPGGAGSWVSTQGETYDGLWRKGLRHGLGVERRVDGTRRQGRWVNGFYQEEQDEHEIKSGRGDVDAEDSCFNVLVENCSSVDCKHDTLSDQGSQDTESEEEEEEECDYLDDSLNLSDDSAIERVMAELMIKEEEQEEVDSTDATVHKNVLSSRQFPPLMPVRTHNTITATCINSSSNILLPPAPLSRTASLKWLLKVSATSSPSPTPTPTPLLSSSEEEQQHDKENTFNISTSSSSFPCLPLMSTKRAAGGAGRGGVERVVSQQTPLLLQQQQQQQKRDGPVLRSSFVGSCSHNRQWL